MPTFEKSRWVENDFSQNYRNEADLYLPFRSQIIEITISFYEHFISQNSEAKVLDLGCGDGLFIQKLLKTFQPAEITLVDGSQEMLDAENTRLAGQNHIHFIQTSFQELLAKDPLNTQFDFIHSSLAIHHIPLDLKKKLYNWIFNMLTPQGHFIHYDVVVSQTEKLENWYLELWKNWIKTQSIKENRNAFLEIPNRYKKNPDNTPDSLQSQLKILKDIGFKNVDCYYKNGIFTLFGGSK